jgi:hypothetical protein
MDLVYLLKQDCNFADTTASLWLGRLRRGGGAQDKQKKTFRPPLLSFLPQLLWTSDASREQAWYDSLPMSQAEASEMQV